MYSIDLTKLMCSFYGYLMIEVNKKPSIVYTLEPDYELSSINIPIKLSQFEVLNQLL